MKQKNRNACAKPQIEIVNYVFYWSASKLYVIFSLVESGSSFFFISVVWRIMLGK